LKKTIITFFCIVSITFAGSANTGWKVILNKVENIADSKENKLIRIDVLNEKGEKAYSISKSINGEMPFLKASVFETGELMLVNPSDGIIEFYDSRGTFINKLNTATYSGINDKRLIKFEIVKDKSTLLVSDPKLEFTQLIAVTSEGEVVFEKSIEGNHATGIELSNSGEIIAAGTYTWIDTTYSEHTFFVDAYGKIEGQVNRSFSSGFFSENEDEFLGYTNSDLFVVDLQDNRMRWSYEFPSDVNLVDAKIIGKNKIVLTADLPFLKNGKWFYSNFVLNVFDDFGKIIEKKKIDTVTAESAKILTGGNKYVLDFDGKVINPF
jgi:hypothetical protein